MAAFDVNDFNVILQEFGANKNRLLPLITDYVQSTRDFSGRLTKIVTLVTQKIGLINARVRGLNEQVQQLNQRIAELQQELANHPAPAEVQRLQQELDTAIQAKNQVEGLLGNVRQQLVEFNQTVTAAPYDTLTADSVRQLNEALENIITSLTEADRTLSASLNVPPGLPPGRGGKRKTKRHNKRSKKHLKKKSKTAKKGKKMRGGYSYGKAKRRYKSRSSSSIPSSLSSASKNIILF